jgi:hypothetical protein
MQSSVFSGKEKMETTIEKAERLTHYLKTHQRESDALLESLETRNPE